MIRLKHTNTEEITVSVNESYISFFGVEYPVEPFSPNDLYSWTAIEQLFQAAHASLVIVSGKYKGTYTYQDYGAHFVLHHDYVYFIGDNGEVKLSGLNMRTVSAIPYNVLAPYLPNDYFG